MKNLFKFPLLILAALLSVNAFCQLTVYKTVVTCNSEADKSIVEKGHGAISTALSELKNQGKLLYFRAQKNESNDGTQLVYQYPAKDEQSFREVSEEWQKMVEKNYKGIFKTFWKQCPAKQDTLAGENRLYEPYIKSGGYAMVVEDVDEKPDPDLEYNIVIDFVSSSLLKNNKIDSSAVNWGLGHMRRIINLHVAAGIPPENIHIVAAVHAGAPYSFLNNEHYKEKYGIDNPNLPLIVELQNAGVRFLMCGQIMNYMNITKNMLAEGTKTTLTAQTTLTSYQLKGYASKVFKND